MTAAAPRQRRLPAQIMVAFAVLMAMLLASLAITTLLVENTARTGAVAEYRRTITDLGIAARDAEIGQRGYLMTGNPSYLQPFDDSVGTIEPGLRKLTDLLGAHGTATAGVLQPLLAAKLTELRETIALERAGRHDAAMAIVRTDLGKRLMDRFRVVAERERAWGNARATELIAQSTTALWAMLGILALGSFAIVALSLFWLGQSRRQLAEVDRARADAVGALAALKAENAARETAEGQVRQLQKMESLGQLTGGIAHDFNNMLAVVMGGIELAKRKLRTDPDRADTLLDNAREGATRAATLTARLLAFSRNQPLAPTPLDVNKLVGGMCDMLGRTLGDAVAVECVYAAGLWRCYADPSEVENAVLNLSINARDAMAAGGKLTVETANAYVDDTYARTRADVEPGQYVLISISDTGHGMAQDVLDRAFDPFFTTKAVGKGTGLGLSQVFGFAKQSRGHVAIYSELNRGTTVKLYLPRFVGADTGQTIASQSDLTPTGSASEVLLVVEDEQRVRHFAVDALRELGYTAISAASPIEALKALGEQPEITLLFTDIVMPDMTGRQLADAALELRPELKVLFTTGYTRNAVVHNGMIDIGVAFLAKPYGMGDLARKIRDVLDGKGVNRVV